MFRIGLKNHAHQLSQVLPIFLVGFVMHTGLFAQSQRVLSVPADAPASHPGRVIVRFRNGATFLPGSGPSHGLGSANLHVVQNPNGLSVPDVLKRYKANPNVLYAEPDFQVKTTATPTDPLWSQQWDMVKIAAPAAWNTQTSASDVIVAVVDTGVDFTHPDLQANLWTNPADGSHGFTCMNGACAKGGQDDYGHGTHVAGTIGAVANDSAGIAGINWRSQILSCKFLGADGSGNISDAVLCFNQILSLKQQGFNIRVTSNSWGGGGFSQALKDAMTALETAGIINVCAAGNSAVNTDITPMYPGGFDNRGIVSVLATDSSDLGASFTNYGVANVDIAAPGVSTLSTVPTGSCPLCNPSGYRPLSGTSMATPHVSGVVAAMFHLNPALTAYEARDVLLDPASYDLLADPLGGMTSTGGRLNFQKAITNPLLTAPKLNNFPVLTASSSVVANAGDMVNLTATASDPDGDPLRMVWSNSAPNSNALWLLGSMLSNVFPSAIGGSVAFQAPALARTAMAPYAVSVSDGRGGSATAPAFATILPTANPGQAPTGNLTVSPSSGPVGTVFSVNFPATDPDGGPVAWDLWQTGMYGAYGMCCQTGTSFNLPINGAGAFRISVQAIDQKLNFSTRQSTVVHVGGATGTPPIAAATFDKLTGTVPLTVNIDMKGSTDPDGTIQKYTIMCDYGSGGVAYPGPTGSCVYDTPGSYWIMLQVRDNNGLMDLLNAYVVATPPSSTSSSKSSASVVLGNLTQTYTGSPLKPTATTNPPGLAIIWTNAPQTNAGTYTVTATVNDPNYQGSASGTFTINKAMASVGLSNLTQTYTGNPLSPAVVTNPPGLAIAWTNAPEVNPGSYAASAAVNHPNYQGSAAGTFIINSASVGTPPSVSLTSPLSGTPQTGTITIQAAATKGTNPIARVDFLVNGTVKCSDISAPYTCSWKVPGAAGKTYQLQAKAYDTAGQAGVSSIVTVTSR